jgi:hypothetical protein
MDATLAVGVFPWHRLDLRKILPLKTDLVIVDLERSTRTIYFD